MPDKTSIAVQPVARTGGGESPFRWNRKRIDWAADGITTTGVYELVSLSAEQVLVDGFVIVTTLFGGASSGTMQFRCDVAGADCNLTAAQTTNATPKGTTFRFFHNDLDATVGQRAYISAADTLDMSVLVAVPGEGAFDLYWATIDIQDNT